MKPLFTSFALLLSALLAPMALGAGGDEEKASNKAVELPGLVIPVADDGKLVNYLFVSARIVVADGHDHWEFREQGHVIRDRILKAAHRHSFAMDGSKMELDKDATTKRITEAVETLFGEGCVAKVEFVSVDSVKVFQGPSS